jgi:hypothetical protein
MRPVPVTFLRFAFSDQLSVSIMSAPHVRIERAIEAQGIPIVDHVHLRILAAGYPHDEHVFFWLWRDRRLVIDVQSASGLHMMRRRRLRRRAIGSHAPSNSELVSTYPQRLQRPWVLVWLLTVSYSVARQASRGREHTACQSWRFPWLLGMSANCPEPRCLVSIVAKTAHRATLSG